MQYNTFTANCPTHGAADVLSLVAMVNHELNTPLTVIRGYTQLLERQILTANAGCAATAINYDAANLDIVRKLEGQVMRMIGLVHDMLDALLFERGDITLHLSTDADMRGLLQRIIEQCQILTPHRLIILDMAQSLCVTADVRRLEQVVLNLVTNALKYSDDDQPVRIGAHLGMSPDSHQNEVMLWVKDKGRGITHEEQERIFEPFFRVRAVEEGDVRGHGLGLYICRQIVAAHHGRIWIESTLGAGSTFYVALPNTA